MAGRKDDSLLDDNFIDGGDEVDVSDPLDDGSDSGRDEASGKIFSEGTEVDLSDDDDKSRRDKNKPNKKNNKFDDQSDIDIDIVDDMPDEDRGKWVVDDDRDGEPDFPSKDEMKQYGKEVRDRINKMTARTHAERRAREQLQRQLEEAQKFAEQIYKQNQELTSVVESGEKVLVKEHHSRLEGQLAAAKSAWREANEAGDADGILAAQESIARIAAQLDRLGTYKPQPLPRIQQTDFDAAFRPQQQPVQPDQKAQAWKEKNRWFGHDEVMTAFALGLHSQLVQREGIDPNRDAQEYYSRLDGELRKRFPEKFKGTSSGRRRESPVAPAHRGVGGNARKVVLTESQVKLARRLGITPEQYARELIKENK